MDSKARVGVKKKSTPKIIDLDEENRKKALLKQRHCDAVALHIVGKLIDCAVEEDVFLQSLKYLNQCHYQDIVEERAITKMCGYPVCPNLLTELSINQTYHISAKSNKVYDVTDRKHYCSNYCYTAGHYIKEQILTSPLWYRDQEKIPKFKLLKRPKKVAPGEEIDQGLVKIDPDSKPNFTSISQFTQDILNEVPDTYEPENDFTEEEIIINEVKSDKKLIEVVDFEGPSTSKVEKVPELSVNNENFFYSRMFSPNLADILSENQKYFDAVDNKPTEEKIEIKGILSNKEKGKAKKSVSFHSETKPEAKVFKRPISFRKVPVCTDDVQVGDVNMAHKSRVMENSLIYKPLIEHQTYGLTSQSEVTNEQLSNLKNMILGTKNDENKAENGPDESLNLVEKQLGSENTSDQLGKVKNLIPEIVKQEDNTVYLGTEKDEIKTKNVPDESLNLVEKQLGSKNTNDQFGKLKKFTSETGKQKDITIEGETQNDCDASCNLVEKQLTTIDIEKISQDETKKIPAMTGENSRVQNKCALKLNESNHQAIRKEIELKEETQNLEDLLSKIIIETTSSNIEKNTPKTTSILDNPVVEHKTLAQRIKTEHFDPQQETRKLGFKNSSTYAQAKRLANKLNGTKNDSSNLNAVIQKINQKTNAPLSNPSLAKTSVKNNPSLNNVSEVNEKEKRINESKNDSTKINTVIQKINAPLTNTSVDKPNVKNNPLLANESEVNEKEKRKTNLRKSSTFAKAKKALNDNISQNFEQRLEECVKQWFTIETIVYLYGEQKVKTFVSDKTYKQYLNSKKNTEEMEIKKRKYDDICRRLNLMELADKQFDDKIQETTKKPLPNYEQLKQQAETMDLRVQAFYSGCFEMIEEDSDDENIEEEDEESVDEKGAPAVLPLVDNKDYSSLRRKIFLSSLTRTITKICEILEQPQNILLTDLKELVNTFTFDAKNIVFKTAEWPVVTTFLVKLLARRNKEYAQLLKTTQGQDYVASVTKTVFNDSLDDFLLKVASMDEYLKEYLKKDVDVL